MVCYYFLTSISDAAGNVYNRRVRQIAKKKIKIYIDTTKFNTFEIMIDVKNYIEHNAITISCSVVKSSNEADGRTAR